MGNVTQQTVDDIPVLRFDGLANTYLTGGNFAGLNNLTQISIATRVFVRGGNSTYCAIVNKCDGGANNGFLLYFGGGFGTLI